MLISCELTAQLICAFGFAYADCWFSGAVLNLYLMPHCYLSVSLFGTYSVIGMVRECFMYYIP